MNLLVVFCSHFYYEFIVRLCNIIHVIYSVIVQVDHLVLHVFQYLRASVQSLPD